MPGIRPRRLDERLYDAALDQAVFRPMIRTLETALSLARADYLEIRDAIRDIPDDPALASMGEQAARAHMQRLKRYHTERFQRSMSRHLGLAVRPLADATLEPIIRQAIRDNVSLIKTIPRRLHTGLAADLERLAREAPFDQQQLRRTLNQNYGSADYNLRRLTRDQTNKTIGKFSEARQREAGLDEYIWSDSGDARVRRTHAANNGLQFAWSRPPATGHPGFEIQCRCVALAVLP